MLEHHVGELVVAVHQARDVVDRAVRPQPGGRLVEAGQLAALDALEERRPAVHLALVEALGPAQVRRGPWPASPPRDSSAMPSTSWKARPRRASRSVSKGAGHCAPGRHRRPPVDEPHQVEGAAEHRRVGAHGDGLGVRDVGARSRASMMRHSRTMPSSRRRRGARAAGCAWRRAGRRGAARRSRSGCPPRCSWCSSGSPTPSPCASSQAQSFVVGDRRDVADGLSSVVLTGSPPPARGTAANLARAASCRLGSHCVGHMSSVGLVVAQHLAGHGHLVHLGRAVGQAHDAGPVRSSRRTASRWSCRARRAPAWRRQAMSCSTVGMTTLTAAMSLRTRL